MEPKAERREEVVEETEVFLGADIFVCLGWLIGFCVSGMVLVVVVVVVVVSLYSKAEILI